MVGLETNLETKRDGQDNKNFLSEFTEVRVMKKNNSSQTIPLVNITLVNLTNSLKAFIFTKV